jgi:16S rRNA pseudouridine516 synthase
MRLDRYLSQVTDLSRSEARSAIRVGRVCIDGEAVRQASCQVDIHTPVMLDEHPLTPPLPRYFMLNKPAGVVCATEDPSHRTVLDLFHIVRPEMHIAGRLDIDATGLVLVTDDGQWSHRITSPNKACGKTYRVVLADALRDQDAIRIQQGVHLHHEAKPTRPARLQMLGESLLRLTITEGKYHQVKRMFAAVGHRVLSLHRESIGALVLDQNLAAGAYRSLTPEEVEFFN